MLSRRTLASPSSSELHDGKASDALKTSSGEDQKWDDDLSDGTPNGVDGVYHVEHLGEPSNEEVPSNKVDSSNEAPVVPSFKTPTIVVPPILSAKDIDLETNAVAGPTESTGRDSLDNSPSNKSTSDYREVEGSSTSGTSPSVPSGSNSVSKPDVQPSSASPEQPRASVPKLTKGVSFAPDERIAPTSPHDLTLLPSVAAALDSGSKAKEGVSTDSPPLSPGMLSRSTSMNLPAAKVQQKPRTRPKLNAQLDLLKNSAVVERISPAQPPSYPSAEDCIALREASRRAALAELDATQGLAVDGLPWESSKARRRDTEVLRAAALARRSHTAVDAFAAAPRQAQEARREALAALQLSQHSSYSDDVATIAGAARAYQERRRALKRGQKVLLLTRYRGPLPTLPPCAYSRAARAAEVKRLVQLAKLPRRKRKRLLPEQRVALMVQKDKKRNLVRCAVPTPQWKVVQRVTEDGLCDAEYPGGAEEAAKANDLPLATMKELLASGDLHASDYKYRFWRPLGLIWDEHEREVETDRRQQNELLAKARKSTFSVDRARAACVSLKMYSRVGASATVRIAREVTSGDEHGSSSASSVSSSDEADPAPQPSSSSSSRKKDAFLLADPPTAPSNEAAEAAASSLEEALYAAGSAAASSAGGKAKEALVAALAAAVAADSNGMNGSSAASAAAALTAALSGNDERRSSTARSSAVSDLTDASSVGGTARSSVASDISDVSSIGGGAYARLPSSGPGDLPLDVSELEPSSNLPPSLRGRASTSDHCLVVDRALFGDLLHPEACADVTAQVKACLCAVGNASAVRLRLNVGGDSTVKSLAAAAAAAAADSELDGESRAARLSADAPPPRLLADALGLRPGAGQRLQPPTGGSAGYTQEAGLCVHLRVASSGAHPGSSNSSSNSSAESSPLFELRTPRAPGGGAAAVVAEVGADGHLRANWPLRVIQTSPSSSSLSPRRHQSGIWSGKAPPPPAPLAAATPPRSAATSPAASSSASPAGSKAVSPSRRRGRPTPPPKRKAAPRRSAGRYEDTPTTSAQPTPGGSDEEGEGRERARKSSSSNKGFEGGDEEEKHMRMLLSMRQGSESHLLRRSSDGGGTSAVSVVGVKEVGGGADEHKVDGHRQHGAVLAAADNAGWESGRSWASTEAVGAGEGDEDLGLSELDELRARMALRRNSRRDADLLETLARATATALEWELAESNAAEVEAEVEEVKGGGDEEGKKAGGSPISVGRKCGSRHNNKNENKNKKSR